MQSETQPDDAADGSTDEFDLDRENTHDKPIDVTDLGDAVHVKETFRDGSTRTEIYTEEQARKLHARLNEIFGEDN
jgi:hypothetical protein